MQSAVWPGESEQQQPEDRQATRQARAFSPFSSSSLKTGTNAAESAGVRDERPHEVRNLEGDGEGVDLALDAEVAPGDDLADEAERAGEAGRDTEDRRRGREVPAAHGGIGAAHARNSIGRGSAATLWYHRSRRAAGLFS